MDPEEQDGNDSLRMFGAVLPSLPTLMFKFMGEYIRFKGTVDVATKAFNAELVAQGIDPDTAERLTELYRSASDIGGLTSLLGGLDQMG
jgi:hypothetical protein